MAEGKCPIMTILRQPKMLDMALFDWVASLLGAFLVGKYVFRMSGTLQWGTFIILWILLGVVVHYVLGIDTMFGYYLGLNGKPKRDDTCNKST